MKDSRNREDMALERLSWLGSRFLEDRQMVSVSQVDKCNQNRKVVDKQILPYSSSPQDKSSTLICCEHWLCF